MLRCKTVERETYLDDLCLGEKAQVVSLERMRRVIARFCSPRQLAMRYGAHDAFYCHAPDVDASPPWAGEGAAGGLSGGMGTSNCTAAAQFLASNFAATTMGAKVNETRFVEFDQGLGPSSHFADALTAQLIAQIYSIDHHVSPMLYSSQDVVSTITWYAEGKPCLTHLCCFPYITNEQIRVYDVRQPSSLRGINLGDALIMYRYRVNAKRVSLVCNERARRQR